jgi:hypothetical protein
MAGTAIIEEAHTPTVAELARGGFLRGRDVARHSFAPGLTLTRAEPGLVQRLSSAPGRSFESSA